MQQETVPSLSSLPSMGLPGGSCCSQFRVQPYQAWLLSSLWLPFVGASAEEIKMLGSVGQVDINPFSLFTFANRAKEMVSLSELSLLLRVLLHPAQRGLLPLCFESSWIVRCSQWAPVCVGTDWQPICFPCCFVNPWGEKGSVMSGLAREGLCRVALHRENQTSPRPSSAEISGNVCWFIVRCSFLSTLLLVTRN